MLHPATLCPRPLTMAVMASRAHGSSVFFSTDLRSSGYLVRRWWGFTSMSLSFRRLHCSCFSAHCSTWVSALASAPAPAPAPTPSPYRHIGAEELAVPQQCPHVLHAALLLHAVPHVGLEEGAELGGAGGSLRGMAQNSPPLWHRVPTHHLEAIEEVNRVKQRPGPARLGQHRRHDSVPQLVVQPDDLPDVAKEPLGIHLRG